MSTSSDYKIQVSLKTPGQTLINIPADSAEDAARQLVALQGLAPEIIATERLLAGAHNAASAVVTSNVPEPQPQPSGVEAAPPSYAPPVAATAPKSCPHGERRYQTWVSSKGEPKAAWFCPLPKERKSEQCGPEWDNEYGK